MDEIDDEVACCSAFRFGQPDHDLSIGLAEAELKAVCVLHAVLCTDILRTRQHYFIIFLSVRWVYIVGMKKTGRRELRVDPDLDARFEAHSVRLNQSASNLLVMLMDALCRAMDRDGFVVMPLQLKTPADCAAPTIHNAHNGEGHQMIRVAERSATYHASKKS